MPKKIDQPVKKVCEMCGVEFVTDKPNRRTCSKKCQYALSALVRSQIQAVTLIHKVCEYCGKPFDTPNHNSRYCSPECRDEAQRHRAKIKRGQVLETGVSVYTRDGTFYGTRAICPYCGKKFVYTDSWVFKDEKGIFYCSWGCLRKEERRKNYEPADSRWEGWV